MEIDKFKALIEGISPENVTFSKHFYLRSKIRGITEPNIRERLKDCSDLILIEEQEDEPKGKKYALLFKMMSNYDLKVVVSIKDRHINVVTAHIQNVKKRKAYQKWLGI